MGTRLAMVFIAAAMTTAWVGVNALQATPPPADVDMTATTASIARPEPQLERQPKDTFVIKSVGNDEACAVTKGEELSPGYAPIRVTANCEKLLPGLASARFWRENEDGSVALQAGASDTIAAFSAGEGVDYESYAPASVLLTLKAQN